MRARIREDLEASERELLDAAAALSAAGQEQPPAAASDAYRTRFQRDRDKIIHCKSFRRLSHKTQVFLSPEGDHFRTRLTHTLEVSQIARSIARSLGLNEDLTEAIALGHDLGHTPFGHTGEFAIRSCLAHQDGDLQHANLMRKAASHPDYYANEEELSGLSKLFSHNVQSLRVVEVIENGGKGLGLSPEVKNGIVCHTGSTRPNTLEGRVVAISDRIAYVNHDIDDAIRAGMLCEADLPVEARAQLGPTPSQRIETLVHGVITSSVAAGDIVLDEDLMQAMLALRSFLFKSVYRSQQVMRETQKAYYLVQNLFDYCIEHPEAVPDEYHALSGGDAIRAVTDFVAGMTDRYALTMFEELFIPQSQVQHLRDAY